MRVYLEQGYLEQPGQLCQQPPPELARRPWWVQARQELVVLAVRTSFVQAPVAQLSMTLARTCLVEPLVLWSVTTEQ